VITTADLCGEIAAEAVRRKLVGGKLARVRLHPATFCRLVKDLGARVVEGQPGVLEVMLAMPAGMAVAVNPDIEVAVVDHPYFDPATGG